MNANKELLGPQLSRHVDKYSESHRTPINKKLHYVGIPLAAVSTLGLLSKIAWSGVEVDPWLRPNLAMLLLVGAGGWYMWWRPLVGLLLFLVGVGGYLVGSMLSVWTLVGMAAVGVVCHFIGHYAFEGKPPQLLTRPVSIIEAPIWLLATLFGWAKDQIE